MQSEAVADGIVDVDDDGWAPADADIPCDCPHPPAQRLAHRATNFVFACILCLDPFYPPSFHKGLTLKFLKSDAILADRASGGCKWTLHDFIDLAGA